MCDSHPVPKVFISLRLLLLRYESHIQDPTFPFLFFHSEKKDSWPKVFFPFRLSSFRNKIHILYPNYTLSFNKLSCECAIVSLFPKYSFLFVYFYSGTKVTFRTQLLPLISFSFTLKRKTHPIPQLYPSWKTHPVLTQNNLPSSFIFIQKQHPIPKLYPFF